MSRQLTSATTLDGLKKEAKRWLKALRANDPDARERLVRANPQAPDTPVLRDVQHALALEYGLAKWSALTQLCGASTTVQPTLQQYQEMAEALLDAYRTGIPAAMERHWKHTWHRRNWQTMRTYVQLDLGRRPDAENQDVEISLADAQFLIAREHGFDHWQALTDYVAALPTTQGIIAAKPIRLFSIEEQGARQLVGSEREWDKVISLMSEQRIPELHADGQMTDAVLERLSRLDHITSLDLNGSKELTDAGLRYLERMPRLQHLNLAGTQVTDHGLNVLRQLKDLIMIDLSRTHVTDTGAANLSDCEHLERVDLTATHTGDGAIRALTGKRSLGHFRSGNNVTDDGLPLFREFPVFHTWQGGDARTALLGFDTVPNYRLPHLRRLRADGMTQVTPEVRAVFPARVRVAIGT